MQNKWIKLGGWTAGAVAALVLVGCGTTDTVDGKAVIEVPVPSTSGTPSPAPVTCYLLEIERTDSTGEETEETYACVSKEVWDRNHVGEEYRP